MVHPIHRIAPIHSGAGSAPEWQFDLFSALLGAAAVLLLTLMALVLHRVVRQSWRAGSDLFRRLRHRFTAGADERYREMAAAWARSLVVPPGASLEEVYVRTDLLAPPPIPQSARVEPAAPAEPRTLTLHQALAGHSQLMILGAPGTGRTTALAHLVLACSSPPAEGVAGSEEETAAGDELVPEQVRHRLPLYVSLPAMGWDEPGESVGTDSGERERRVDDTERLLGAAVAIVGGGGRLASSLRLRLQSGRAVVLVDGWDDLPPGHRQASTEWLARLVDALPENLWLVVAGTRGHAPLIEIGFSPLTLARWDAAKAEMLARGWAESQESATEPPSVPAYDLAARLRRALRKEKPPLELALHAFVSLSGDHPPATRGALFGRALELLLQEQDPAREKDDEPGLLAACRTILGQVALTLRQEERGAISRQEIEAAIEATLPPVEERATLSASRIFGKLTGERGLLCRAGPDRYAFAHSLWQAHLAARQLTSAPLSTLLERLEDPRWSDVLLFYAETGNVAPLVSSWLKKPDDIFCTRLRILSSWIRAAPPDTPWRNGAMAILARSFLQGAHPPPVQEALARALAATESSGVAYFFNQALQHPSPGLRIAALAGMARITSDVDVTLFEEALEDEEMAVRLAAVRVLASLDTGAARQLLETVLHEGEDAIRIVAAEELVKANRGNVAYLREMAKSDNVVARRAAVFGLRAAGARDVLAKLARDDEQWAVRTAAAAALEDLDDRTLSAIGPPPRPERLPWLISWAAVRGEGVGTGNAAQQMLRRALSEGDSTIRLAAAQVLAQTGSPADVDRLRAVLADPDPATVDAAFRALVAIGERHDLHLGRHQAQVAAATE
jgi:HEAT repeat protein